MTENLRSKDIEQSNMTSSAINAIYLNASCMYDTDTLKEVLGLLRRMEEAAYSEGASDALEKVRQAVNDSVNLEDGIICDWTEDAYNRVMAIIAKIQGAVEK